MQLDEGTHDREAEARAAVFGTERMALEMSTLYSFGLQTGSTLSTQEVLKRTGANIEKLMKPDTYYIALYDEATNMLTFDLFVESGQPMPKMKASVSEGGLTASIVQTRQPLLVQDWLTDGAQYNSVAKKIGADMLSYLGVPMFADLAPDFIEVDGEGISAAQYYLTSMIATGVKRFAALVVSAARPPPLPAPPARPPPALSPAAPPRPAPRPPPPRPPAPPARAT
jgi:transcriptional regulator with GAF, ATPase, and Fis domain